MPTTDDGAPLSAATPPEVRRLMRPLLLTGSERGGDQNTLLHRP